MIAHFSKPGRIASVSLESMFFMSGETIADSVKGVHAKGCPLMATSSVNEWSLQQVHKPLSTTLLTIGHCSFVAAVIVATAPYMP